MKKAYNFELIEFAAKMGNELTESMHNLDIMEHRLISYACTKIKKHSLPSQIIISPIEFADKFNLAKSSIHKELKKSVLSLASKYVTFQKKGDEKKDQVITWLHMCEYERNPENNNSEIHLYFNPLLHKHLYGLNEFFTLINLNVVTQLNTIFSYRLYQWICKDRYLRKTQANGFFDRTLSMEWISKRIPQLELSSYSWDNFKKRHLTPAIEKINACNDITVTWKPVRHGKQIKEITFTCIEEKSTTNKPIRPALLRRPKVAKGSHEEGLWARGNIKLLTDYRTALKTYDKTLSLSLPDLRKLHEYHVIIGDKDKAEFYKSEIDARTPAKKEFNYDDAIKERITEQENLLKEYQEELEITKSPISKKVLETVIKSTQETLKILKGELLAPAPNYTDEEYEKLKQADLQKD